MLSTALVLVAALATSAPLTVNAQDYGRHQAEVDAFMSTLEPALEEVRASLPRSNRSYTVQVYALDRDEGVYVALLRNDRNGEIAFEVPIDKATPKEAAQDTAKNVSIAIRCDIAGEGLTACHRGTDAD